MRHGDGDPEPTLSQMLVTAGRLVEGAAVGYGYWENPARTRFGGRALIALHVLHDGPATTYSLAGACRTGLQPMQDTVDLLEAWGYVAWDAALGQLHLTVRGAQIYAVVVNAPRDTFYDPLSTVEDPELLRRQLGAIIERLGGANGHQFGPNPAGAAVFAEPHPAGVGAAAPTNGARTTVDGRSPWRPVQMTPGRHRPGETYQSPHHAATKTRLRYWILPALVLVVWLLAASSTGPVASKLGSVSTTDVSAFLPSGAEATKAIALQSKLIDRKVQPAVVVYERPDGIDYRDVDVAKADLAAFQALPGVVGPLPPVALSKDNKALQVLVPIDAGADVKDVVSRIRETTGKHPGLSSYVTGPAGVTADAANAAGDVDIDGALGLVAVGLVLVILLVVYRSPILPVIVLVGVGFALALASAVVYPLAKGHHIELTGQGVSILSVLVIGACTDYALLLAARYRDELRHTASRFDAIRSTVRATAEPILASGATVIFGVMCLFFSDIKSQRGVGPVAALGIAASLLVALTFFPAAFALLGRVAFWPLRPMYRAAPSAKRTLWTRVADLVGRRPRLIWTGTVTALLILAGFAPYLKAEGISQADSFLRTVESVQGQDVLGRHFPAGAGNPAVIITRADAQRAVIDAARRVDGVQSVAPDVPPGSRQPKVVDGLLQLNVTLSHSADSPAAKDTVRQLRHAVGAVPGADAVVGGDTAIQYDMETAARRDRFVIIPAVLAVILLILMILLRAIVMPVLLLATAVLSFGATLGVSSLVFTHIFDFASFDPAIQLFAFIFLTALGVDYNIFLMSRAREETMRVGPRRGMLAALHVTGGVITSAGVVLAATFAALAMVPVVPLVELGFAVGFGVLLDTIVVRSLLVPGLAVELGRWGWWPGRLSRRAAVPPASDAAPTTAPPVPHAVPHAPFHAAGMNNGHARAAADPPPGVAQPQRPPFEWWEPVPTQASGGADEF
jgi:RND superfamily putative drug exporter